MSSPKHDLRDVANRLARKARSDEITLGESPPDFPPIAPNMVAAVARPGYVVRAMFADGEIRDIDIKPLLDTEAFSALRDTALFEQVRVDEALRTVVWPNKVDLDPDVIYAAMNHGPRKARIKRVVSGEFA